MAVSIPGLRAPRHKVPAKQLVALALIALAALGSTLSDTLISAQTASAASSSDWNAGYIVSDANFYDGTTLDATGLQSFLASRNSGCSSGRTCILNYTQNTPTMAADSYCKAITGIPNESAASIIARVGMACGISQKTLVILIEKEQGLVSSHGPSQYAWDHATGFACPDTAACDPTYASFFYQIYSAARQFDLYRAYPNSFGYKARATNNILYNPGNCSSSPVYIANDATAALYIYTPYQPNAAALANMYGVGDGCSSYGNRNFWAMWTDWFGSPTGAPITIAQLSGTQNIYLIASGRSYSFTSSAILSQYSAFGTATVLTQSQLSVYPNGGSVQNAVKSTDGSVWLIDGGWRFRFSSCQQVVDFGMNCSNLPTISASILSNSVVSAGDLRSLVQLPDGSDWLMQNGVRHEVPNPSVLAPYGISSQVSGLTNSSIGNLQLGPPVVGTGLYSNGTGALTTIGGNNSTYPLPSGSISPTLISAAYRIQPESYDRLPAAAGALPSRVASDGQYLLLTTGGWLIVNPAVVGTPSSFTAMPSQSWSGIPLVGSRTGALFLRSNANSQVMLANGGYLQPVAAASVNNIASMYGMDSQVWVSSADSLTGLNQLFAQPYTLAQVTPDQGVFLLAGAQRYAIPQYLNSTYASLGSVQTITSSQMSAYAQGANVMRAVKGSNNSIYLLDSGRAFTFQNCAQVTDYGINCDQAPMVITSQLSNVPAGGTLQHLARAADGTTWLIQNGQRRQTPDPSILAPYGIPSSTTALSNALLSYIAVGPPAIGPGPITDGQGNYRAVGPGGAYALLPAAAAGSISAHATLLQAASWAQIPALGTLPLRATADGRYFVSVDGGWLQVDAATYGGQSNFTQVPSGSWTGASIQRIQLSPHFIRERSSSQVYLVSGGSLSRVADQTTQNWISRTYGVENKTWIASDGALSGLPVAG